MIEIMLTKDVSFDNPAVIEGFPGVGLVGHIAATYLVNQLNLPEIGYIRTDLIPQIAMVFNGQVMAPMRIYGDESLIVFVSDLAFSDDKTYYMAERLGEFMSSNSVTSSLSLAGIGIPEPKGNVFGVGSTPEMTQRIAEAGIDILPMGSISGGSGALLLECHRRGIPSMALLAETVGNRPDPRSASFLLERVSALIGREVDTSSLVQEADQLESTLATLSRDVEKQSKREEFDSMYM
jgi:uncharacterized protein